MNVFSKIIAIASLLMLPIMAVADDFVSALSPNVAYVGRVTFASGKYARFNYPGVQIHAAFEGTSLKMKMKPNSGYYMVEIDDKEPFKVKCPEADSVMHVISGLPNGTHRATITFATEGLLYQPQFWGFLLDKGCTLAAKPELPQLKFEFIGNSITCGFGIEGASGKEKFRYSTQNQYYTYEAITARNLHAQCLVVARSGIGVYRNCGGKLTGDKGVMPHVYPYTLFGSRGEKWDFSRYIPDVVCINLGTNDTSNPRYYTDSLYNAYVRFYHTLRSHYPQAKIVILSGTMIRKGSEREQKLNATLDRVMQTAHAEGDPHVYRLDLTPEDGTCGWGSCFHPSKARHAKMAEELTAFLRTIL